MNSSLAYQFFSIKRRYKRVIFVLVDLIALTLALWSGFALRLTDWWPHEFLFASKWLFLTTPLVGVFVFARLGLYRAVLRFIGSQAIWTILKGIFFLTVYIYLFAFLTGIEPFSRSVPLNFALTSLLYVAGTRMVTRAYYNWLIGRYVEKDPVLI